MLPPHHHLPVSLHSFLRCLAFSFHLFGLPANWLIIFILWGWDSLNPEVSISFNSFVFFILFAVFGECVEFALQIFGARKYGASSSGNWGALAGAFAGAIFCAPLFFGLGATGDTYFGCLGVEMFKGCSFHQAKIAAWGAMVGKVLGLVVKIGIGIALMVKPLPLLIRSSF